MSLESKRMHLEISGCLIMRMTKMKVNLVNMKYQVKTGSHTLTYYVIVNLIKKNILQSLDSLAQNKRSTIREQVTDLLPNHVIEKGNILGRFTLQMPGQLMIFPFFQYSLKHDLALMSCNCG